MDKGMRDTPHPCAACPAFYEAARAYDHKQEERDHWIRLFNRLDAAVSKHRTAKSAGFEDDTDEALHAAHDRILKAAATHA